MSCPEAARRRGARGAVGVAQAAASAPDGGERRGERLGRHVEAASAPLAPHDLREEIEAARAHLLGRVLGPLDQEPEGGCRRRQSDDLVRVRFRFRVRVRVRVRVSVRGRGRGRYRGRGRAGVRGRVRRPC